MLRELPDDIRDVVVDSAVVPAKMASKGLAEHWWMRFVFGRARM